MTPGIISVINTQTEKVFGYTRDELLGQSVEMIIPQPPLVPGPANRALSFASPKVQLMGSGLGWELYGRRKDGTQFPIEISQSPLQTETGLQVSSAIWHTSSGTMARVSTWPMRLSFSASSSGFTRSANSRGPGSVW